MKNSLHSSPVLEDGAPPGFGVLERFRHTVQTSPFLRHVAYRLHMYIRTHTSPAFTRPAVQCIYEKHGKIRASREGTTAKLAREPRPRVTACAVDYIQHPCPEEHKPLFFPTSDAENSSCQSAIQRPVYKASARKYNLSATNLLRGKRGGGGVRLEEECICRSRMGNGIPQLVQDIATDCSSPFCGKSDLHAK